MGDLWQLDPGRYRIVYVWKGGILLIVMVFPKSAQAKTFRHLHQARWCFFGPVVLGHDRI
ncbi:MAG: hypothetical protein AUJ52_07565 [Elusimicrobia bacterium CG1_02_63_36]|nr:MAG: hypothetical protein AUJ52_07565 [Elusimicrobia bacterium CG1_02_63_36]